MPCLRPALDLPGRDVVPHGEVRVIELGLAPDGTVWVLGDEPRRISLREVASWEAWDDAGRYVGIPYRTRRIDRAPPAGVGGGR
jgi:hypothetical protein